MNLRLRYLAFKYKKQTLWQDREPIREELFGIERMEKHAASLAQAQILASKTTPVLPLRDRLEQNAKALITIYRDCVQDMEAGKEIVPAAEWLLDNYHVVEAQIQEIRQDLPARFYQQLPKLAHGPFAGYPRVFGIAWAFIAHSDSHLDPDMLNAFLAAYQRVEPLTIGELWAVPITLRIVLIENLGRLGEQITREQARRDKANALAECILREDTAEQALADHFNANSDHRPSETFVAQLVTRLRAQGPITAPVLHMLNEELQRLNLSIDEIVEHIEHRQSGANVSIRNVITSMRLISDIDWAVMVEQVSLVDAALRRNSQFALMNFATRNLYRTAVEDLARHSEHSELEVVNKLLDSVPAGVDPGFYLIGQQRPEFERALQFKPPARLRLSRFVGHIGITGFVSTVIMISILLLGLALYTLSQAGAVMSVSWALVFALLAFLPATEVAMALFSRLIVWSFNPSILPGMALQDGVPDNCRTLVAVPTLLTSHAEITRMVERLEVHYLTTAGTGTENVSYALITDWLDAPYEVNDADRELLRLANESIAALNSKHKSTRFLLLHRCRTYNSSEDTWMGWERKRGKLHELNLLLRGSQQTTFLPDQPSLAHLPKKVRYVLTLDSDTRLVSHTLIRLIGKMAHPLNQPHFDPKQGRITRGYGILQPRVTPAFPSQQKRSLYQRIFSGPGGIDPYASAASDLYQDLFQEGSFTGKGIYDVDAFEAALANRIPENTLLSHDLFEGIYARAGLASDVEVVEEFPESYDVAMKRQHRWTRGDWQLLTWILNLKSSTPQTGSQAVPILGRFKMLDNLRRSLIAPFTLAALASCIALGWPLAGIAMLMVLLSIILPAILPVLGNLLPHRHMSLRSHVNTLWDDIKLAGWQIILTLAFLPDQAIRMGDAIGRTLIRMFVTHHHMLEWTTAAQLSGKACRTLFEFYREMAASVLLALLFIIVCLAFAPSTWPYLISLSLLWLGAPYLAYWSARPLPVDEKKITADERLQLRLIARRTWRYFETFVTPASHMLPPDNFQETPNEVIAQRTSPTNISVYLLSTVAARDFAWAGLLQTIERLEATFTTMAKMPRYKGHFFNWYDTAQLTVLNPPYISSVDSGNLAGHLLVVANACEIWQRQNESPALLEGLLDNALLAQSALSNLPSATPQTHSLLLSYIEHLRSQLAACPGRNQEVQLPDEQIITKLLAQLSHLKETDFEQINELEYWLQALLQLTAQFRRDQRYQHDWDGIDNRLQALADSARRYAMNMDFSFLVDPQRQLLSIGYSLDANSRDESCYDLLASEARLASLFAIAKGDIKSQHWFRLGRSAAPAFNGSVLLSWSGSMFEYLMPSLVMRTPASSLLAVTTELAVKMQQHYGKALGIPWGMSESAFNARDHEFTYQYSNFGVPELGLKRGLSAERVVAPYASGLASLVNPSAAYANYLRLAKLGALGRYGYYEALDFTLSRVPEHASYAIVRSFMAHHQGMTIAAIANALNEDILCARFHREPMIQACELLLQERMPREIAAPNQLAAAIQLPLKGSQLASSSLRVYEVNSATPLTTHLLSNGHYSVMLTATGSGFSRWRDIAVTRWLPDHSFHTMGSFLFLHDIASARQWSMGVPADAYSHDDNAQTTVVFVEDHAEFSHFQSDLSSHMDVAVSMEDAGEVRRLCLTNFSSEDKDIEVTSYTELVLNAPAADQAHPAFSKMFVQTEYLAEFDAIIASRRPQSLETSQLWAAHLVVGEGELSAAPQFESDRARFLGRGQSISTAHALIPGQALSNSCGTVLDPVFSLRRQVKVPSGATVRLAFWTLVAESRSKLMALIDKYHDRNAYARARTLAWTQAQLQLRHLNISHGEAVDFQRLATAVLYPDAAFRSSSETIRHGAAPQSSLWECGISGDLPIVLLYIDNMKHLPHAKQLIRGHEYWQLKQLCVDLVIVNEQPSSYIQELQDAIEAAIRYTQLQANISAPTRGAIYPIRADQISLTARTLLASMCTVKLHAAAGNLHQQLNRILDKVARPVDYSPAQPRHKQPRQFAHDEREAGINTSELEFFNGTGGFARNATEYVTLLKSGQYTEAPWINVIANPHFGFQVSAEGSGYTWARNSKENQLTPWCNDPVSDPSGEQIYLRDNDSMRLISVTANASVFAGDEPGLYLARHGFGYSCFEHQCDGLALKLLQFVHLKDPIKISRLSLHNTSKQRRNLSVIAYVDWILGASRASTASFIQTEHDEHGAIFAHNPWSLDFSPRVAFIDMLGKQHSWTADRQEFMGRHHQHCEAGGIPFALRHKVALSGKTGVAIDPCAALQQNITLAPNEQIEVVILLGQGNNKRHALELLTRHRHSNVEVLLQEVTDYWQSTLGKVQVRTPDRAMDIMLNGWLMYQTLACRLWARAGFYQASGAYGFRDQLQDTMALVFSMPDETRAHILRAAARQFEEGDVQHWWLPHSGTGVRTRISDGKVWLAYATARYVQSSGDVAILSEQVPFLKGENLKEYELERVFSPEVSSDNSTLFEHCKRAIDLSLANLGEQGLPLIGTGDWNDGMNRVGVAGKGESVWLGWLLLKTLRLFMPLAKAHDEDTAKRWRKEANQLRNVIEQVSWDGEWYRRATFDSGEWLGSTQSTECRIDSIAQSWAVLSGGADHARAVHAMSSFNKHLVLEKEQLVLLFTPPFNYGGTYPGYIQGYPPGLRENGGQYSHAAMWAVEAFALLGDGNQATKLFAMLNPINHALDHQAVARYKVEPYVVAADIYSQPPHRGRGGWTWYSGAAGCMYRAGLEGILGVKRRGDTLRIKPAIARTWSGYQLNIKIDGSDYQISVHNPQRRSQGISHVEIDDKPVQHRDTSVDISIDGKSHKITITM